MTINTTSAVTSIGTVLANTSVTTSNDIHIPNDMYNNESVIKHIEIDLGYKVYHGYVSGTICMIGILGNICNITIWSKRRHNSSADFLLTALGIADLVTVLFYCAYAVYLYIATKPTQDSYHSQPGMYLVLVCFHEFITASLLSSFFTITLAIFRYIKISYPVKSREFCSLKRAKIATFCVVTFGIAFCVPFHAYYKVQDLAEGNSSNPNGYWLERTDFAIENKSSYELVIMWLCGIIMKLIPCLALILLSLRMLYALHVAGKLRKNIQESCRDKPNKDAGYNRTSVMLITVVLVYATTALPIGIAAVVGAIIGGESQYFYFLGYSYVGNLLNLCPITNASLNIFVYAIMSKQYRNKFSEIILRKPPKTTGKSVMNRGVSERSFSTVETEASVTDTRPTPQAIYTIENKKNTKL